MSSSHASSSKLPSYRRYSGSTPSSPTMIAEEYELSSPPASPRLNGQSPTKHSFPSVNQLTTSPTHSARPLGRPRGLSLHDLSNQSSAQLMDTLHLWNQPPPSLTRKDLPASLNFTVDETHHPADLNRQIHDPDGTHSGHTSGNTVAMLGLGNDDDTWDIARGMKSGWRRQLFLMMEEPTSSDMAFHIHWGVTALILISACLTVFSTLPGFHKNPLLARSLFGLDTTIVVLFTVEYLARLLAHSDNKHLFWSHFSSFFGIIDLLAIFPYYIEILVHADTSVLFRFSILRTFRLLRVFRAFRYSNTVVLTIEVMRIAIKLSQDALLALLFFILMVVIIFSTLVYFAERGTWDDVLQTFVDAEGDPTTFGNIPAAAWFVLVTITTVGYGEVTPRSALGKIIVVPLLMFGLLLIALPSFVLGRNFATVWDALRHAEQNTNQVIESVEDEDNDSPAHQSTAHSSTSHLTSLRQSRDLTPLPTTNKYSTIPTGASPRASLSRRPPRTVEARATAAGGGGGDGSSGGGSGSVGMQEGVNRLSNMKLARNQEALSGQIDSLREVVESQGRLIARLVSALESKEIGGSTISVGDDDRSGKRRENLLGSDEKRKNL
ncbi:voltage-gated potassium channel [Phaffia rhodozyma]|uniref:Voltage-gated potassium channel n=1 Tax=Phaffia rhodozyma TaxID=264483 RepID=A0A0F7SYM4_PHARH|nr:voltage-gated potassium channel [Phaffia rhodozyma]